MLRLGHIVSYKYLWSHEAAKGYEEGKEGRPCVIVNIAKNIAGQTVVEVAPITHRQPHPSTWPVPIKANTARSLKLDERPSWIVLTEKNRFVWPGPDLEPRTVFGRVTKDLVRQIKDSIARQVLIKTIDRDHGLSGGMER